MIGLLFFVVSWCTELRFDRPSLEYLRSKSREFLTRSFLPSSRISLNWPLDAQGSLPFFGRQAFHKDVYQKHPRIVNDDTWSFNSQSSSQCPLPISLVSILPGLELNRYNDV